MRLVLGPLLLLAATAPTALAQRTASPGTTPQVLPGYELLVSGFNSNTVHRFSFTRRGVSFGDLGSVRGAQSVHTGPDGLLYVVAEKRDEVRRYRRARFLDLFVWDDPGTPEDETGGLDGATAAIFGPDGNLYVAGFNSDSVLCYDGATGSFLREFVSPREGGLDGPDAGMVFGPDGHLYVPSFNSNQVLRYDGASGDFLDVFIPPGGGVSNPRVLLFLPNGEILLSCWGSNRILRFDAEGNFLELVTTYQRPTGLAIGPEDGLLYVTSDSVNRVWQYDLVNRVKLGSIVPAGSHGLNGATYLRFVQLFGEYGFSMPH